MAAPVWIVNLGTTQAPTADAVREFLAEFLSDPLVVDYPAWLWRPILSKILRSRPEKVAELYRSIWTPDGSPLAQGTERIADALRERAGRDVRIAYRYGRPSLRDALAEGGTVVSLFPQRTCSTTGSIESALSGAGGVELRRIAPDDPGYIEATADLFHRAVGRESPEHFVVSFHGIPVRYDRRERGMYRADCERTFHALLTRIGWPEKRATLSYQSRFGPEPWLKPATASVLTRLGRTGVKSIAVATPGFLTEGLETLEEIGIRGKESFLEAGGERFVRIPAVEAHPRFIESLAALVAEART
jgi:ferrochelatase